MATTSHRVSTVDRRRLLQIGAATVTAAGMPAEIAARQAATPAVSPELPVTGDAVPELAAFDEIMATAMAAWNLPGGQMSIARDARLVYNRGFGYGDVEANEPVQPDHLFRIASCTKPITAVVILMLVDAGKLALDTPVFPLLELRPLPSVTPDPRLDSITIEHLLTHTGGWDSVASGDPQYQPRSLMASHVLGAEAPPEAETIIRYLINEPLDFDPGSLSAYSNFGFNVLGRVIEHVSGQAYEQFVIDSVLKPAGITEMAIAGTRLEERLPGEVRYYSPPELRPVISVYPEDGYVPVGYGGFFMRAMDAHGGWAATTEDLVRFTLAIDGTRGDALLSDATVTAMETTPRPPTVDAGAGNVEGSLGLGWGSVEREGGFEWSHAGALEGSNACWVFRGAEGTTLAVQFNTLPQDYGAFFGDLFPKLIEAISTTSAWPDTDLFSS